MHKVLVIVPVLAALALSACGSSSDGSSSSAAATTAQRGGFMNDEVRACLQQQGVDVPERPQGADGQPPAGQGYGGVGGPGSGLPGGTGGPPQGAGGTTMSDADRQKMQDALKKCGVDLPADGQRPAGDGQRPDTTDADYQARVKAYVACVRENGFDLPDPDFSGDGPIFDPDQVDQTSQSFRTASAKCQSELQPSGAAT